MKQVVVGPEVVQVLLDALFQKGLCGYFVHDYSKRSEIGLMQICCQKGVVIGGVELVDREAMKEQQ